MAIIKQTSNWTQGTLEYTPWFMLKSGKVHAGAANELLMRPLVYRGDEVVKFINDTGLALDYGNLTPIRIYH